MSYEKEERRPMRGFRPCRVCGGSGRLIGMPAPRPLSFKPVAPADIPKMTTVTEEVRCTACAGTGRITI